VPSPETFTPGRPNVSRSMSNAEMALMERVRSSDSPVANGGSGNDNSTLVTDSGMQGGPGAVGSTVSRSMSDAEIAMLSRARISFSSPYQSLQTDREDADMQDHGGR
jgi:hypothetical protein